MELISQNEYIAHLIQKARITPVYIEDKNILNINVDGHVALRFRNVKSEQVKFYTRAYTEAFSVGVDYTADILLSLLADHQELNNEIH